MGKRKTPVSDDASTEPDDKILEKAGITAETLNRLRMLAKSGLQPREWREIYELFPNPIEHGQRVLLCQLSGLPRSSERIYRPMANIPMCVFEELASLHNSGSGGGRGNASSELSLEKFTKIGQYWSVAQLQLEEAELKKRVLDLCQKAVAKNWNARKLEAELFGRDSGGSPKPDIICQRLESLATALATVAPSKGDDLREAAGHYRRLKLSKSKRKLSVEQRNQIIDCVLAIAGVGAQ